MDLSNLFKIAIVHNVLSLILYISCPGIYSDLCLKFWLCKEVFLNFIGYIKCLQYLIVHIATIWGELIFQYFVYEDIFLKHISL